MTRPPEPILSELGPRAASGEEGRDALARVLLEACAVRLARSKDEAVAFVRRTLYAHQLRAADADPEPQIERAAHAAIDFLIREQFVRPLADAPPSPERADGGAGAASPPSVQLQLTALGTAAFRASLSPLDALVVHRDLEHANDELALANDLHLLYLLSPPDASQSSVRVPWAQYFEVYQRLESSKKEAGAAVGISERYLNQRRERRPARDETDEAESIHGRFWNALVLHEQLHNPSSVGGRASVLAAMENFDRGSRESLRKNASYNAGAIVTFCGELNWR